jgi:hypothetical protein
MICREAGKSIDDTPNEVIVPSPEKVKKLLEMID